MLSLSGTILSSFLAYCSEDSQTLFFFPPDSHPENHLLFQFNGENLSDGNEDMIPRSSDTEHINEESSTDMDFTRPALLRSTGTLCVRSTTPFFFDRERGIRFSYCDTSLIRHESSISNVIRSAYEASKASAYPSFEKGKLRVEVIGVGALRKENNEILYSMDGSPNSPGFLEKEELEGSVERFRFAPSENDDGINPLPRSFPDILFHTLITEDAVTFVYPLPEDRRRFLTIRIRDKTYAESCARGMEKMKEIYRDLVSRAGEDNLQISEVAFSSMTGAEKEFLEISAGDKDFRGNLRIETDGGYVFDRKIFLFAGSGFIYSRTTDPDFRLKESFSYRVGGPDNPSGEIRANDLFEKGGSSFRTLSRDADEKELRGSIRCIRGELCGSRGLSPSTVREIRETQQHASGSDCSVDDLELSELNPFGIVEDGEDRINIGGKFMELEVKRSCHQGNLVLLLDHENWSVSLDPGQGSAKRGEHPLFVASGDFFMGESLRVDSSLRSLKPYTRIRLKDLTNDRERLLHSPAESNHHFIYGTKTGDESPMLRRVYSLIGPFDNSSPHGYHSGEYEGEGLRPDIAPHHGMSPGSANTPSDTHYEYQLAEIAPAGSRDSDGNSIGEDEFLELRIVQSDRDSQDSPSAFAFHVLRHNDHSEQIYHIPPPLRTGRIAFIKDHPTCWKHHPAYVRFTDLYLPNSSATYSLTHSPGNHFESVVINNDLYKQIKSIPSSGYQKIFASDSWRITDQKDPLSSCGVAYANPGETEKYLPFLKDDGDLWTLYTQRIYEIISLWTGPDRDHFREVERRVLSDQESIRIEKSELAALFPDNPRLILGASLYNEGRILLEDEILSPAGLLYFDTIQATPVDGEEEWIRLCSNIGFHEVDDEKELFFRDNAYEDRIVPYSARFPIPPFSIPSHLRTADLDLSAGGCVLLVDPDQNPSWIQSEPTDEALWTIEESSALGNGLSSGEGMSIFLRTNSNETPVATFGRPDFFASFSMETESGQYLKRQAGTHDDSRNNWEVLP